MITRMITTEEKIQALSSIHPSAHDLDYLERHHPGCLEWFQEKLTEPLLCIHKGYLQGLVFELELSHRLGLEPRTGILLEPIFRRLLSFLCISRLSDYLPLPSLLESLEWPPGGGRGARITAVLNGLVSEPLAPEAIQAASDFAQAHPDAGINVTTEPPQPPQAHTGDKDEIEELLNVEW